MRVQAAMAVMLLLVAAAPATQAAPTLRDRQQAACFDDAMRLCGQFAPDEDKVTACMRPKKAQVSDACRALWEVK